MTEFSALMQQLAQPQGDGAYRVNVSEDWRQGRTAYGGLSAAIALRTAMATFPDLPPLRSAQIAFIGPSLGEVTVTATELRRGKSAVYISVDSVGEAGLATPARFCIGTAREVAHTKINQPMPQVKPPEECPDFFIKGVAPVFTQHFDGQFAAGTRLFSGADSPAMSLWLRHRDAAVRGVLGNAALVAILALADCPPPAAFVMYQKFVPISTMTWQIDLMTDDLATRDGWWLLSAEAEATALGYSGQAMKLWDASGRPVAAARQTIAVFG
jgi:acyl-CoA thioesterase